MDSKSLRFITHRTFFSSARDGDLNSLKQIVENLGKDGPSSSDGSSPVSNLMAVQNDAGETALYIAAENNCLEVFRYLIQLYDYETVKIRSKFDMDAFHVAAKRGHVGIIKELLANWPELCKICDSSNTSPLYSAAAQDHLEVVNAILDVDISAARRVRRNGKTALHTAARYGLLCVVETFIAHDPGIVGVKDNKGQTALHMAAKGQNACIIEIMLDVDPSLLNEPDKRGNTPLHVATRKSRPQVISIMLSQPHLDVNVINKQQETAMDVLEKLQYGQHMLIMKEALRDAGAKHAKYVILNRPDETLELNRTVSDIKHELCSQEIQNEKTDRRVTGIAKEVRKLHREAVQNTTNSITVAAVLFASTAFLAMFNLPGLYVTAVGQPSVAGTANIAESLGFQVFCILNTTSLFVSLAVVVVQVTLVAWGTTAQSQVVSIANKLMWGACACTCGAFLSIAFVVVGKGGSWMGITITLLAAPILFGTLASMCYFGFRQRSRCVAGHHPRPIKHSCGSISLSRSVFSRNASDLESAISDLDKIYAL